MTKPPVLAFRDLEVGYGRSVVLHDISAKAYPGECIAVTGANGSGKSTLVRALMGIGAFQRGEIDLLGYVRRAGAKPTGTPPWGRVGYVPQRTTQASGVESAVGEVVAAGLLGPRLFPPRQGHQLVQEALEKVGMAHREKEAFAVLSGGQQQRVLIARALVRDPALVVMDEPLTGLDRFNRERLAEITADLVGRGVTALIVLHELGELRDVVQREWRLAHGHLVHDGPCTHEHHYEEGVFFDHALEPERESGLGR